MSRIQHRIHRISTTLIGGLLSALIATTAQADDLAAHSAASSAHQEPTTLWLQHQRLAFGLGHEPIITTVVAHGPLPTRGPLRSRSIGLGLSLTPATMLTWETDAKTLTDTAGSAQRLGLSFQSRNADGDVKGLFRVQLSSQSVLQWRPRKDGLRITYKATF